jgi:hypothetical protein
MFPRSSTGATEKEGRFLVLAYIGVGDLVPGSQVLRIHGKSHGLSDNTASSLQHRPALPDDLWYGSY